MLTKLKPLSMEVSLLFGSRVSVAALAAAAADASATEIVAVATGVV